METVSVEVAVEDPVSDVVNIEHFFSEIARTKMSTLWSQCGNVFQSKYDLYLHTYR